MDRGGNDDMKHCVDALGLEDIPFSGKFYTKETRVYCKLDRVMANGAWFMAHDSGAVRFLESDTSDHSPF